MKPITPQEVAKKKAEAMPPGVIEAFNELIAKAWDGSSARVTQDDAVRAVLAKLKPSMPFLNRNEVFQNRWLDVEDIFRQAGWRVEYDKPGYCESYEAFFVFRAGK